MHFLSSHFVTVFVIFSLFLSMVGLNRFFPAFFFLANCYLVLCWPDQGRAIVSVSLSFQWLCIVKQYSSLHFRSTEILGLALKRLEFWDPKKRTKHLRGMSLFSSSANFLRRLDSSACSRCAKTKKTSGATVPGRNKALHVSPSAWRHHYSCTTTSSLCQLPFHHT